MIFRKKGISYIIDAKVCAVYDVSENALAWDRYRL